MNLLELREREDFERIPIHQKKLLNIKYPTEKLVDPYFYPHQEWN